MTSAQSDGSCQLCVFWLQSQPDPKCRTFSSMSRSCQHNKMCCEDRFAPCSNGADGVVRCRKGEENDTSGLGAIEADTSYYLKLGEKQQQLVEDLSVPFLTRFDSVPPQGVCDA